MNNKLKLILVLSILISLVFLNGGDIFKPAPFKPSVTLTLDKNVLNIKSNVVSEDFITATITRLDDKDELTSFVLMFPDKKENIYPTDVDGKRVEQLQTKPIKGNGAIDTLQFKVFGNKGEADKSTFSFKVQLVWNNSNIAEQTITVNVK